MCRCQRRSMPACPWSVHAGSGLNIKCKVTPQINTQSLNPAQQLLVTTLLCAGALERGLRCKTSLCGVGTSATPPYPCGRLLLRSNVHKVPGGAAISTQVVRVILGALPLPSPPAVANNWLSGAKDTRTRPHVAPLVPHRSLTGAGRGQPWLQGPWTIGSGARRC